MKIRHVILLAFGAFMTQPLLAQSYSEVPTVRYEGRPVEEIVKDGLPVARYDGDGRVIVDKQKEVVREKPVPPRFVPNVHLIRFPWQFGLPRVGPRYVWGRSGDDAVLFDRVNGQPVHVKRLWYR